MVNLENTQINTTVNSDIGRSFDAGGQYAEFDYSADSTDARDVLVTPDATRLYIVDRGADDLIEYTFGIAGDVSTLTKTATASLTNAGLTDTVALAFGDNGRDLITLEGENNTEVGEVNGGRRDAFDIVTNFDGSNGSTYNIRGNDVDDNNVGLLGTYGDDRFLILNDNVDTVYRYANPRSVDDASDNFQQSANIGGADTPVDIAADYTGSVRYPNKLYVLYANGDIKEFSNLGSNLDINSLTDEGVIANTLDDYGVGADSISVGMSDRSLILQSAGADTLYSVDISQNFLSTVEPTTSFDASAQSSNMSDLYISPDGGFAYVSDATNADIYQYTLETRFDITTATLNDTLDVSGQDTSPTGVHISADGTKLYISGDSTDSVHEYTLSTPEDLSTASATASFDVSAQDTAPEDVFLSADGEDMLIAGSQNASIYEYALSTAFDVTSASLSNTVDVSAQGTSPTGVFANNEYSRLYVTDSSGSIFEYRALTAGQNLSYVVYSKELNVTSEDTAPAGVSLGNSESSIFIAGSSSNSLYEYSGTAESFTPDEGTAYKVTAYSQNDIEINGRTFTTGEVDVLITAGDTIRGEDALINGYQVK